MGEKVEAWKSNSGSLFETEAEMLREQSEDALVRFIQDLNWNSGVKTFSWIHWRTIPPITEQKAAAFILDNFSLIKRIIESGEYDGSIREGDPYPDYFEDKI